MENFVFCNPARIYFGRGQEQEIGTIVSAYSHNILLVYGKASIKKSGLYDLVMEKLNGAGIHVTELAGVEGNPKLDLVYQGIELCREASIDFILAVGGGSVIDTAKAIAAGVKYEGDVWDLYIKKAVPKEALPIGTILTVVGAGSEMSNSNVINKQDENLKRSFDHEVIIPKFSILNPELTYTVSPFQTACGAFDAMSHLMERYFTLVRHTDVTDRMLEGLMRTIITYTPLALVHPDNYDYRAELMWASTLAQNGLLNTGRIGDWGCHAIEHELSGEFDIPHGAGLAMITTYWMRYVYREDKTRFVQFASRVFDVDFPEGEEEEMIEEGICRLESFIRRIGLPVGTESLHLDAEMAAKLGERAVLHSRVRGRFLKMDGDDIGRILMDASSV